MKYLVDSGYWEDLRAEPYNVEQYTSDMWEYVVGVGTDDSGAIRALSWQASPGSIMYRRDMALEVLGTEEPQEVSALLNSNEAMLEAAAKFKEAGIKMFASWAGYHEYAVLQPGATLVVDGQADHRRLHARVYGHGQDHHREGL